MVGRLKNVAKTERNRMLPNKTTERINNAAFDSTAVILNIGGKYNGFIKVPKDFFTARRWEVLIRGDNFLKYFVLGLKSLATCICTHRILFRLKVLSCKISLFARYFLTIVKIS